MMPSEQETDEITRDELEAELNEVHDDDAEEADIEAALSNFLAADDEHEPEDDTVDDGDGDAERIVLKCQKCGDYVKRGDIAAHYTGCDG